MKHEEMQFLNMQQKGRLWRAQIVVAALVEPPQEPQFDVLHVSPWMKSPEAVQRAVLPKYFQLYRERQGFKHPEDPTRTASDPMPDCGVLTMRAA